MPTGSDAIRSPLTWAARLRCPRIQVGDRDVRYPRVTLEEVVARAPELIVLPDEPHRFTCEDASVFRAIATPASVRGAVVRANGKDLCWYGSRSVDAIARVRFLLVICGSRHTGPPRPALKSAEGWRPVGCIAVELRRKNPRHGASRRLEQVTRPCGSDTPALHSLRPFRDDLLFESYRGPQPLFYRKIYRSFTHEILSDVPDQNCCTNYKSNANYFSFHYFFSFIHF